MNLRQTNGADQRTLQLCKSNSMSLLTSNVGPPSRKCPSNPGEVGRFPDDDLEIELGRDEVLEWCNRRK